MMETNKYFNHYIDRLDVNQNALEKLKANEIITLGELSNHKKSQLKNFGIQQNEISKIEVELELLGLSLKGSL